MFDEARAMSGTLALCKLTQEELAKQMGVSQSYIANKLRLLNFSDIMKERIRAANVSERHARAILRLDCEEEQMCVLEKVIDRGLTVRECEAIVDSLVDKDAPRMIGLAERRSKIDVFIDTLKRSLETLSSIGIDANLRQSYYGSKTYITISLDDSE